MKHSDTHTLIVSDGTRARRLAAAAIKRGDVIAFRTDTFYGLGADPFNRRAIAKIKALKGREEHKPILIVVSDSAATDRFIAEKNETFFALAAKYWPGALTLVIKARPEVPEELTAGTGTIGLRLPAGEELRALIRACGGALTATSANPSTQLPAFSADEAAAYFPHGLTLIVDGGNSSSTQQPSTVVEVSGGKATLLREGVVAWDDLQAALRNTGD